MNDFEFNAQRIWRICKRCVTIMDEPRDFGSYNLATAMLLFGTAAQESSLRWERQRSPTWDGKVGGFSKWQLEKESIGRTMRTLRGINPRSLKLRQRAVRQIFNDPKATDTWIMEVNIDQLLWALRMEDNDHLGVMLAREHYRRVPDLIPTANGFQEQIDLLAVYWKNYYNTYLGAGTPEQFCNSFKNTGAQLIVFEDPIRKNLWKNG